MSKRQVFEQRVEEYDRGRKDSSREWPEEGSYSREEGAHMRAHALRTSLSPASLL
jgi:hypothetical protein